MLHALPCPALPCPLHLHSTSPQLVDRMTAYQEKYEFSQAGDELYAFIWGEFADWYVEASKARLYR